MNNPFNLASNTSHPLSLRRDFPHQHNSYDIQPNQPMGLDFRPGQTYTQRQMKQLVEQMRFKQKMQAINKKKGKYKRSTNNCHKKYIGILKNLVFLKINSTAKQQIVSMYFQYRNSRVYYFIILSYLKWHLSIVDIKWVYSHFCKEVQGKMDRYKLEISTTNNINFIHFRRDQIIQMDYSVQAINHFLRDQEEEAIRNLYQKNKYIIIKKNQYLKTIQIISQLRLQMESKFQDVDLENKLSQLKLQQVYSWKKSDNDLLNSYQMSYNQHQMKDKANNQRRYRENRMKQQYQEQEASEQPQFKQDKFSQFGELGFSYKKQDPIIKKQEPFPGDHNKQFPLINLQNSYPVIDFVTWNSWLLQKQKRFEFYIKTKEQLMTNNMNTSDPFLVQHHKFNE